MEALRRVLIVDFDADSLRATAELLRRHEFEVETASSIPELVRRLETGVPRVVLIEPSLEGRDGFELCRSVLDICGEQAPTVLLASRRLRGKAPALRAKDVGAQMFLELPGDEQLLVQSAAYGLEGVDPTARSGGAGSGLPAAIFTLDDAQFEDWMQSTVRNPDARPGTEADTPTDTASTTAPDAPAPSAGRRGALGLVVVLLAIGLLAAALRWGGALRQPDTAAGGPATPSTRAQGPAPTAGADAPVPAGFVVTPGRATTGTGLPAAASGLAAEPIEPSDTTLGEPSDADHRRPARGARDASPEPPRPVRSALDAVSDGPTLAATPTRVRRVPPEPEPPGAQARAPALVARTGPTRPRSPTRSPAQRPPPEGAASLVAAEPSLRERPIPLAAAEPSPPEHAGPRVAVEPPSPQHAGPLEGTASITRPPSTIERAGSQTAQAPDPVSVAPPTPPVVGLAPGLALGDASPRDAGVRRNAASFESTPLRLPEARVEPARLIATSRVEPRYPPAARHLRRGGTVVLGALIDADGTPGEIEVLDEPPGLGFGRAAAAAVRRWRYEPATHDGRPQTSSVTIRIEFRP